MRVRFIYKLKNRGGIVPFHHQHLLAQLIKGLAVKGGKSEFMDFKNYNFSGLKGQTRVSRKGLHFFSSRVTLVFSSTSEEFIEYVQNQMFELPQVEVGNLILIPESLELEEESQLSGPTKFVCISPIILNEPIYGDKRSKRFIHPESDQFSDLIFESTINRVLQNGDFSEKKIDSFYKFQIVPDKAYIKKLDDSQKKYARIYSVFENDIKYEVRGYTFPFTLYAAEEILNFIINNGLGYFTHKGFGMLDLAENNKTYTRIKSAQLTNESSH